MFAVLGGAVLVVLGSFLPWVEATVPFLGSVSLEGTEGDGKLTLALGLVVGLGFINHVAWRVVGLVAAIGALAIALYDIGDIANALDEAQELGATASVGIGLWVVLVGALAGIVGIVQRSGWLDRWGTRRYYAMGAACVLALGLGLVLSDSDASGIAAADADPFASEGVGGEPVPEDGGQLGLADAGDQDADGTDDCLMFATEPAEYDACEDAGSDPAAVWDAQNPGESYVADGLPTDDAGDPNGDGVDECVDWATTDAEFDACEDWGSDPAETAEARETIGAPDVQRPGEQP